MAVDPFNSVGGYTVGIPPVPIIDENGNLTVPQANIGGVEVTGDAVFVNNVTANLFIGTFSGNISGNIVVPGADQQVLFNNNGQAGADSGFTYDYANTQTVTVHNDFVANSVTIGSGANEFSTSRVVMYTTASTAPNQVLHQILANTVSSVDYVIIATDSVGNNRQITKLFAGVLGTDVGYYEVGSIDVPQLGPGVGDFRVTYDTGNVVLTVTPVTASLVNYKVMVTSYKE
jgi:hypothetical protein